MRRSKSGVRKLVSAVSLWPVTSTEEREASGQSSKHKSARRSGNTDRPAIHRRPEREGCEISFHLWKYITNHIGSRACSPPRTDPPNFNTHSGVLWEVDMSDSAAIVQKLWNYCNVLRDDGLSYQDYLEQLTFLLFLKMADEQARP